MLTLIIAIVIFLLGFYVCSTKNSSKFTEGMTSGSQKRCPNILMQKGKELYLFNDKLAKVPGVNPIKFNNLEEYTEFVKWQRNQGIRCPVLFLQHSYDTQGESTYKVRPSPFDLAGGLPEEIPKGLSKPPDNMLVDAGRNDPPYNTGDYPAFDAWNQYIGEEVPLDKMFHLQQKKDQLSDNAMDTNWGGPLYSEEQVATGKYSENEVNIWANN
jgi:hypothetical protein